MEDVKVSRLPHVLDLLLEVGREMFPVKLFLLQQILLIVSDDDHINKTVTKLR